MRVLALHGFRTSGTILREQLKPLSKLFPQWEFTFLNAPNPAQGEPEEVVKVAFPQESSFYEWYGYEKNEDGSYHYLNFEASVNAIKEEVSRSHYDVLLGFSQGGCLAALLTSLCEQGQLDIPAHRRWKYAVLLNAPFPRGKKVTLQERWCTPTLLSFGSRDALIDPAPWKLLANAVRVSTEEGHALPRIPASVEAVSSALRQLVGRTWFAFDFDGVVCDSARETGKTAWLAGAGLFPGADGASKPDSSVLDAFCAARPLLETGFEALVIMYRLTVMGQTPETMLASSQPAQDMEDALQKMGCSKEELKDRFQRARDAWIARDEQGWLAENGFYGPIVNAMKLLHDRNCSVYVVTTKHASFAQKLLKGAGVNVPEERIFGLGSGKKREVLTKLAQEHEAKLGGRCVFIEDRVETLRDVAKNAGLPVTLVVAGHGYNTSAERARAREADGFLVFDTSDALAVWIDELSSQRSD